eukprot:303980-Chlamydomonas_euryale.AAC.5
MSFGELVHLPGRDSSWSTSRLGCPPDEPRSRLASRRLTDARPAGLRSAVEEARLALADRQEDWACLKAQPL